ncbi:MAG: ISLre2 family transposase [Clostridia bacterium]|nr:ISLre2 family transposase [Clostridia bacterium]
MYTTLTDFFDNFKKEFSALIGIIGMPDPEDPVAFSEWAVGLMNGNESFTINSLEEYIKAFISETCTGFMALMVQMIDEAIRKAKSVRKDMNMIVERRDDHRELLLSFGTLSFSRTYYKCTGTDGPGYTYPIDTILGIDQYQRLSSGISNDLTNAAITRSFQKASEEVTGGAVSAQTVMNKLRQSTPPPMLDFPNKLKPDVLHIDVDEDHVHVQRKGDRTQSKSVIVPLATVYEGISHHRKRGICRNAFSISRYGVSADDFWDNVVSEIEKIYDISDTLVYIHGDGAKWIKAGLDWFPHSTFVLDEYHKNKYIKKTFSGIPSSESKPFHEELREILKVKDKEDILCLQGELVSRYPDRIQTIMEGTGYLYNNFDGIRIRQTDPESSNGGATEPHVSHTLSARLSSRPMGWSEKTLKAFAPILAKGKAIYGVKTEDAPDQKVKARFYVKDRKVAAHPFSRILGLPDPTISVSIPTQGKVTPLYKALKPYFGV